ncbi:MAG: ABC transporter substrate-binding protein [Alphaproteobacteria bacterium]|nr:ABC transporter substrate-binding protein [Alphaproteobacteria bacterium]MBU1552069.1 ABC transporter substrate-binding protein [Alphaproteobacteria bacterium]MBU2337679.1 ABC transporter substrate-binding protein [Alphaproteobacteria bacterium]MBU2391519.1 ABC transporter substrate-binding protein [Alphaproteobacteria bacterium]
MSDLKLSLAMGNYDRTRAIIDGRVKIDGVDPVSMLLSPEEMFFRAFRQDAFDVSELSLSSYSISVARGNPHYVAIPVFLSRAFRHTSVYIRTDRGIDRPEDLKGRRIGIAEYQLSANVWVRGILEEHFSVKPSDVTWVRGGMDTPGRPEKIALTLPDDITIEAAPEGATLNGMLAAGEIDGFIGPRWPRCFAEGHPHVGRLFRDSIGAAEDYFRQTRIFPVMHVLGVRRSLVEQYPFLPAALLKAFSQSKKIAEEALNDTSATKVTMPFVEDTLNRARALMGPDPWSYGLGANAHVLDKFLDYHFAQGLSPRRVQVEELFHPSTLEAYSL